MASIADLREAITAGGGGAAPLVQKIISTVLMEYVRKFSPLRLALPRQTWDTDTYFFNQRTAINRAQFVTEAPPLTGVGSVVATTSTYIQLNFAIKHFQSNGDVSLFAQKVARVNGSLLNLEMEGALRAMGWLEELAHLFGSAQATLNTQRPAWDGFRQLISPANKIDAQSIVATTGLLSFAMLDNLMDAVRVPLAANPQEDNWFILMSPRMQSRLVQLTTPITRVGLEKRAFRPINDGGVMGAPIQVDMTDPGVEVYSYRGIPIVLSSFLSTPGTMGSVALAQQAGTTPFLSTAVRKYQVTALTIYGETQPSAEQSITVSAGTGANGNSVTLTWSTPTIPDPITGQALPVVQYAIWESLTAGAETLLAIVPAFDANDVPVTSWTDFGAASTAATNWWQGGIAGDGVTFPNQAVAGQANGNGCESIYLISRDPQYCVVPTVNDLTPTMLALVNARSRQFAITADECLAVRAGGFMSTLQRVRYI